MTDNLLLILLIVGLPTLACLAQDYCYRRAHRRRLRNRYRSTLVRSAVALARRRAGYTSTEIVGVLLIFSGSLMMVGACARIWGVL